MNKSLLFVFLVASFATLTFGQGTAGLTGIVRSLAVRGFPSGDGSDSDF